MPQTKRFSCIVLLLSMLVFSFPVSDQTARVFAASGRFLAGAVVQAEDGAISNDMKIYTSKTAGGGKAIGVLSGSRIDNALTLPGPDASYSFQLDQEVDYKLYIRCNAPSTGADSFWYRWDSASAYTMSGASVSTDWIWLVLPAKKLSAGSHTLDIIRREPGMVFDLFVLSTELTDAQKQAIEEAIVYDNAPTSPPAAVNSTAVTFNATNGSVMFEAEEITLNTNQYAIADETAASGGKAIYGKTTNTAATPSSDLTGAEFNINIDQTDRYSVWVRYTAINGGEDSIYCSLDGAAYNSTGLVQTKNRNDYQWQRISQGTAILTAGTKHNFKLYPREPNGRIDKIIVTCFSTFIPTGMGNLEDIGNSPLPSGVYPLPTITPPPTHPRLFFTPAHISGMKANMPKAQNANALASFQTYLTSATDGKVGIAIVDGTSSYNATILAVIESWAFDYAVNGNTANGNKAISAVKNFLNTVSFSPDQQDVTRPMGHTIFVASEVYDWCYPLLTSGDKSYLIAQCESIAGGMEVGWPPNKQGAVVGHAGEAQLLRDLLGFGIATYNERPDIYNYVAGRLLSQFLVTRNTWYPAHTYHQGDSYGGYRYNWDMVFLSMMKQLSGEQVFIDDAQYVPYQWIYERRPDGKVFRNGDSYNAQYQTDGAYWSGYSTPLFFTANFFHNPYLKYEMLRQNPNIAGFSITNGMLTPVQVLIFNDPDLAGEPYHSFPLSKYFGSPYGMMVARTGWSDNVDYDSPIAMAEMHISELWAANHQHLDAGSFQLYYKGILALDSGIYDSYGTTHDYNYNKETIAHNSLLIYDPSEPVSQAVNSGGQRRPGSEPSTINKWLPNQSDFFAAENTYVTGKVLAHQYDTDHAIPQYSYIKGDITRAYTNKVSEVLRSMLFLPLEDANHPAALIVMDKVTATNPIFKKTWLLHTQQEPQLSGKTAFVVRDTNGYNGRMDLTTLLPQNVTLTKIGGAGSEYMAGGQNWAPTKDFGEAGESGAWRIEVSPEFAGTTDYFLNVMQVSDSDRNAVPLLCPLIETAEVAGTLISNRAVIFAKGAQRLSDGFTFTVPGDQTNLKLFVAGVKEGIWKIQKNNQPALYQTASAEGGTLYFTGNSGTYTLAMEQAPSLEAPPVLADDVYNQITGLDLEHMEYAISEDAGLTYGSYTSANIPFLGGNKMVKVRFKTENGVSNEAAILRFTVNFGDIDGDGWIDISDVVMTAEIAVGNFVYSADQVLRANVSDKVDISVDISDVILIAERAVGDTSLFPVETP